MSYFQESLARPITYYHKKCGQILRRTMASFDLSQLALTDTDPESFASNYPDLFDDERTTKQNFDRMQTVLIKSHFLLLKVELELFLHLLGLECWRVALLEVRAGKARYPKKVFKNLVSPTPQELLEHNDNLEALCATAVPQHGLTKITDSMKLVDTDLLSILNSQKNNNTVWSQVFTAFHVRHLIEHRNGYIDEEFRSIVAVTWPKSSWGDRLADLEKRKEVTIAESDLRATAKQMNRFLEVLEDLCIQLKERRDILQK
jgi:hypothetical protein